MQPTGTAILVQGQQQVARIVEQADRGAGAHVTMADGAMGGGGRHLVVMAIAGQLGTQALEGILVMAVAGIEPRDPETQFPGRQQQ